MSVEKAYDGANGSREDYTTEDHLQRVRTAGSVNISAELFEKIYLSPQNNVKGDLRLTFANPTPVALAGFLLTLTPLSMILLGWQGAGASGNLGASNIGVYLGMGGPLLIIGAVGEFILGNTFPMVVFFTYGAFWLVFGMTLDPWSGAIGSYAPAVPTASSAMGDPTAVLDAPLTGLSNPEFVNSFGHFLICMACVSFVFFIVSVRTNIIFFLIFLFITPAFALLAAAFWELGQGIAVAASDPVLYAAKAATSLKCQHAGAALAFVVCLLGWYILLAIMLVSVDFPFGLPLGDLSTVIKGASSKTKKDQ